MNNHFWKGVKSGFGLAYWYMFLPLSTMGMILMIHRGHHIFYAPLSYNMLSVLYFIWQWWKENKNKVRAAKAVLFAEQFYTLTYSNAKGMHKGWNMTDRTKEVIEDAFASEANVREVNKILKNKSKI